MIARMPAATALPVDISCSCLMPMISTMSAQIITARKPMSGIQASRESVAPQITAREPISGIQPSSREGVAPYINALNVCVKPFLPSMRYTQICSQRPPRITPIAPAVSTYI